MRQESSAKRSVDELGEKVQAYARAEWGYLRSEACKEWEERSRLLKLGRDFLFIATVLGIVSVHQLLLFIEFLFFDGRAGRGVYWVSFWGALILVVFAFGIYRLALRQLAKAFELQLRRKPS